MLNPKIDCEDLCRRIGIIGDEAKPVWDMAECIPTLAYDIYVYANYDEIKMDCEDRNETMEHPKDYYGTRILNALEMLFCGKSKDGISHVVEPIIHQ